MAEERERKTELGLGPLPKRIPTERPGPVGGKRHQNRLRRVRELCSAALDLFLVQGIEGVSIDEIVKRAGVAKGSFYRYFDDKEQLVDTLISPLSNTLTEAFGRCSDALESATGRSAVFAAYTTLAVTLTAAMPQIRDLARLYLQENRAPAVGARQPVSRLANTIETQAIELTIIAHQHGLLREYDARVTTLLVIGAVERILFAWLTGRDLGDPIEASRTLIAVVLEGMQTW